MKKDLILLFFALLTVSSSMFAQKSINKTESENAFDIQHINVEKGQYLSDFIDIENLKSQKTDINPGIDPEGDFMLRSTFSTDGTKVFVVNGGTSNITVFDFETMTAIANIDVGYYPCDIAVTDDYAIVSCIYGDEIDIIDLSDYSIASSFYTSAGSQPAVVEVSPDGNFAYIACDITDQLEIIDLTTLTQLTPISGVPINLQSFSWISTGGRSAFKFSRFEVSPDGNHIIVSNASDKVLFINTRANA